MYPTPRMRNWGGGTLVALLLVVTPTLAEAQTWVGGRTTPNPGEIVAVDRTGEENWLFGAEDVAGDGLETFADEEQSFDVRSAYAASTADEFYFRMYVSRTSAPVDEVSGFVFIDADRNKATGGSAEAPEVDPRFTNDPSDGGYEYVFAVRANGSVLDLWAWDAAAGQFATADLMQNRADAEAGNDSDPLTSRGPEQGYLQGWIELDLVGLDASCDAELLFRSLHDDADLTQGDLDVGLVGPCHPHDGNNDGVPDRLVPEDGCDSDAECPVNSVCLDGRCVFTGVCDADDDCDADEECNNDGYCIASEGDSCSEAAECSTQLCEGDSCARCGGDADCADGYRCAADGRCVSEDDTSSSTDGEDPGLMLEPGEEVQGGACTCGIPVGTAGASYGLLLWPLLVWWRRRK